MRRFIALAVVMTLLGCARTSVVQLSENQARILVDAATVCGPTGAQHVAYQQAAVATISLGYDRFRVLALGGSQQAAGYQSTTYGEGGLYPTTINTPYIRYGSELHIEMFREGDQKGFDAVSARATLGADWQSIVESGGP